MWERGPVQPQIALFAAVVGVIAIWIWYGKPERLPNVPFLRISDKPGKAGDASDVQAFLDDSLSAIMKGYNQFSKHGKHFLLRTPTQVYFMAAPSLLDEIRKMPENKLSQPAAANIIFQIKHTFHPKLLNDYYHFDVVRKSLTQGLPRLIPDLASETQLAFELDLGRAEDWKTATVYPLCSQVITRVANRMMVGTELCRNDEFLHYSATYTKATFDAAAMLRNVPEMFKSLKMRMNTDHRAQSEVARRLLVPLIKGRLYRMSTSPKEYAMNKPNDAVQWLLDITPPEKRDPELLLQRMIHINVTAIHAPTVTLTECVFDLCRHPDIHAVLRDEIYEVMGSQPADKVWTKANIDRLSKLDSFIRESSRLTPMSAVKMERLAVQDFMFSDGTFIPKGTSVGFISHGRHLDPKILSNATEFDAFRYDKARREQEGMENQLTFGQASSENLLFGLGRHACPGRHFASALIKMVLVHILVNYDIKFIEGRPPPQGKWTQKFRNPDFAGSISWRDRPLEDKERFATLSV